MSTLAEHLREQMIAAEMADDHAAAADFRAQLVALATAASHRDVETRETTPMTDPTAAISAALEAGNEVGWQITDADGNVVASGPVTFAHMTSELAEQFGIDSEEGA